MANILIGFLIVCFIAVVVMLVIDRGDKKDDRPIILGDNSQKIEREKVSSRSDNIEERTAKLMRYVVWGEKYRGEAVGESFYQNNLLSIVGSKSDKSVNLKKAAVIIHEPNNEHDRNAHAVVIDGKKVGYLSKSISSRLMTEKRKLNITDCLIACPAIIDGGWKDKRSEGNFGVKLDLPPINKIGLVLSSISLDDSLEKFKSLKP